MRFKFNVNQRLLIIRIDEREKKIGLRRIQKFLINEVLRVKIRHWQLKVLQ